MGSIPTRSFQLKKRKEIGKIVTKKRIAIRSAKAKGRNFQNWVAEQISKLLEIPYGKDELIASREAAQSGTDIRLIGKAKELFNFAVECKAQETLSLYTWIIQAESNSKNNNWLLFHKKARKSPIVIMGAEEFFKLVDKAIRYDNPDLDGGS